jgi:hypothetical protein
LLATDGSLKLLQAKIYGFKGNFGRFLNTNKTLKTNSEWQIIHNPLSIFNQL